MKAIYILTMLTLSIATLILTKAFLASWTNGDGLIYLAVNLATVLFVIVSMDHILQSYKARFINMQFTKNKDNK